MKTPNDFYFHGPLKYTSEAGLSPDDFYVLIISKEFWDAGEGLDCVDEPKELFDMLEELGGFESMENVWEFPDITMEEARKRIVSAGFVENKSIGIDWDDL